jgi:hypothetical protein
MTQMVLHTGIITSYMMSHPIVQLLNLCGLIGVYTTEKSVADQAVFQVEDLRILSTRMVV